MRPAVTHADAPGKLFVTGEWAVLAGAPAVVAAVDRRATVQLALEPADGRVVVESLAEGTATVLDERDGAMPGGDAGAVAAAVRAARMPGALGGTVRVDSRAFLVGERKLGLGRSAATLAAATAVVLATAGRRELDDVWVTALAANAFFQDGRGSGADVAAAVHGGVIEARPSGAGRLAITRRALPAGITLIAGWTGAAALTRPLLDRFAAAPRPAALADLVRVAEDAADAVARGDGAALVGAVDRSADLLERLGAESGVPIVTPALARLVATARRIGVAAKPSGAGGGDCGIALATSPAQAGALCAAWQEAGILPLAVPLAGEGVRVG